MYVRVTHERIDQRVDGSSEFQIPAKADGKITKGAF